MPNPPQSDRQHAPREDLAAHAAVPRSPLTRRHCDYLRTVLFILAQHKLFARALDIADVLISHGHATTDIWLSKAILHYRLGDSEGSARALKQLSRIDPSTAMADEDLREKLRARSFLEAANTFAREGHLDEPAQAAIDFYMRLGSRRQ